VILDTSVLVAAERRSLRVEEMLRSLGEEPIAMAAITASELLHGCHRAGEAGIRARRWAFVEGLLQAIPILPFGLAEARRHAELWADLIREGGLIGPYDMLVGATALARGYALATLNRREFARIPGLKLVPTERFTT
jgi:tRNA(fMet)-specific endonuclease VapC